MSGGEAGQPFSGHRARLGPASSHVLKCYNPNPLRTLLTTLEGLGILQAVSCAEVVKLVDALRSGRSSLYGSGGSSPPFGTNCVGFISPQGIEINLDSRKRDTVPSSPPFGTIFDGFTGPLGKAVN
jgi:hypothetical protein